MDRAVYRTRMDTSVYGTGGRVTIGPDQPTVIVGDRIRAASDTRVAEAVHRGDVSYIQAEAKTQAEEGADIIGLWLGVEGIDEEEALPRMVEAVAEVVAVPVCFGSSNPKALEAALEACPGKPLISPITAEQTSLEELLPVVVEHKAAVVAFGWNREGLPREFEGFSVDFDVSFELTRRVLRRTLAVGIPREDILIGVSPGRLMEEAGVALEALSLIGRLSRVEQLNVALEPDLSGDDTVDTAYLRQLFLTLGMQRGVTCAIGNPTVYGQTTRHADFILGRSPRSGSEE